MSVKHVPSLATVSQMHTDGTLHLFSVSCGGWVTRSIFKEAMDRWTAWEQIQDSDWEKRPKLLLMDGHAAHTDVASIKHLQDVGMRCAVPPGASSHMWQVLDNGPIGVFRKGFARIRLGAAAATLTGAVPCPATIIGLRKGVTSPKVFAELEVDSGEGKPSGIFVRLKDARKTKVHPSDTLCAGYHAWVAAATPAVRAGGFVRTGTFAKGFTPDSKPTCDPEKILERMEAHRGGYDRDAIAAAVVERAMKSISDKSVLTPEFTSRMKKELDIIRVATNYGFVDDVDGPNRAKRMALDLDNRQLVARTTDDFLRGNERYERHQRQLDVTDAHFNQIGAQARADHVLKSLRGLLEQAKRANAKARTTLKTISGTDVAQQASTSLAMIDSVLNTQATPTKAVLKRDLLLDSPAASLVMDKLRLVKQLVFVGLQLAINIDPFAPLMRDRKTKIVATLGPKTLSVTEDLIRAGVAVARINCSHGDPAYYEKVVSTVRAAVDSINAAGSVDFSDGAREDVCAIAFDTKGPEIRTGINKDDAELELAPGDEIVLTTNASARESGSAERVFVDWARLAERVKPKQRVVLDDGVIALDVVSVARSQGEVRCKVVAGGILGSRKGVHLPGVPVDLPAVSDKDLEDIACAKRLGADFIFASFIREAGQVEAIRALAGPNIQIISKIENKQGVDNFDAILSASDGIMVARGDLGIEVPLERVFLIQKQLIAKCNRAGKPAICATQMLESMTYAPLPTRAECVDVGNACMDGADAVMLSGETAKGKFPVKTVATMAQLCKVAEASEDSRAATLDIHGAIRNHHAFSPEEALAAAAVHASVDHDAKAILAITTQGTTARQISKFRPRCPIVCLTFSAKTARALQLCKGVHPLVVPSSFNTEQLLAEGERAIEAMGLARPGEKYLAVHSVSGEPRHGDPKTLLFASIRAKDEEDADRA